MRFLPTRSAWLHLRFAFSWFLLPVFIFAISQAPRADTAKAILAFLSWHFFIYPASNGYNSYFDKDEGSIALIEAPPRVDKSLYWLSLCLDVIGILSAFFVSPGFALAVFVYGLLSKCYSHPAIRLKKYPWASFFLVFFFQGAFVYYATLWAVSETNFAQLAANNSFILAGLICSCLIGASYPLTQVYQHEEDSKRGDRTLSLLLGTRGSFWFAALMFFAGACLQMLYWSSKNEMHFFYAFLLFASPAFLFFIYWFVQVWQDKKQANFRNMSIMTTLSGTMILLYFLFIWMFDRMDSLFSI